MKFTIVVRKLYCMALSRSRIIAAFTVGIATIIILMAFAFVLDIARTEEAHKEKRQSLKQPQDR